MSGTNKLVVSEAQESGASEEELAKALLNANAEAIKEESEPKED